MVRDLLERFEPLFRPRSMAVVGASASKRNIGTVELEIMRRFGYRGALYAVHPTARQIAGVSAFPSIRDVPGVVDYAHVTLAAEAVPGFLREAAGKVHFAQVISSGFSEVGHGNLEAAALAAAREGGIRLVGPNCLGTYCPAGRLTFLEGLSAEPGPVAVASQSGGLGADLVRRGRVRGLRFSKVVTVGNGADLDICDFLEYFGADPETRIIGLYLENLRDGRRWLDLTRQIVPEKPVVVLRGGASPQGQRSAALHTGKMATAERVWRAICRQAGVLLVGGLEDFLDLLAALQFARPGLGRRMLLIGPGGGAGVLAADACDRFGFQMEPVTTAGRAALETVRLPPGSSLANPIDTPVQAMQGERGQVLRRIITAVQTNHPYGAVLVHLNLQQFFAFINEPEAVLHGLVDALVKSRAELPAQFILALRSSGELDLESVRARLRQQALEAGIPVFHEIEPGIRAYGAVLRHRERQHTRTPYAGPAAGPLRAARQAGSAGSSEEAQSGCSE